MRDTLAGGQEAGHKQVGVLQCSANMFYILLEGEGLAQGTGKTTCSLHSVHEDLLNKHFWPVTKTRAASGSSRGVNVFSFSSQKSKDKQQEQEKKEKEKPQQKAPPHFN